MPFQAQDSWVMLHCIWSPDSGRHYILAKIMNIRWQDLGKYVVSRGLWKTFDCRHDCLWSFCQEYQSKVMRTKEDVKRTKPFLRRIKGEVWRMIGFWLGGGDCKRSSLFPIFYVFIFWTWKKGIAYSYLNVYLKGGDFKEANSFPHCICVCICI